MRSPLDICREPRILVEVFTSSSAQKASEPLVQAIICSGDSSFYPEAKDRSARLTSEEGVGIEMMLIHERNLQPGKTPATARVALDFSLIVGRVLKAELILELRPEVASDLLLRICQFEKLKCCQLFMQLEGP